MTKIANPAKRPPQTRSRVTNGSRMLQQIDGRSAEARRYRDLVEGFARDFGVSGPGERESALLRQAAALTVQAELMQAAIIRGDPIDVEQLVRVTNAQSRTLGKLGIRKPERNAAKDLAAYIAAQASKTAK